MKHLEELKAYSEGLTEKEIADQLGVPRSTIQSRLKTFRATGVLTGSHKDASVHVNWEDVNTTNLPQQAMQRAPEIPQKEVHSDPIPQKTVRNTTNPFTNEEIEALKELARREMNPAQMRSREMVQTSLRLDTGLLAALKELARERHITTTEAFCRAIEGYLS